MSSILKSMNWLKLTLVVLGQRRQTGQKQKKLFNKHAYSSWYKSRKFLLLYNRYYGCCNNYPSLQLRLNRDFLHSCLFSKTQSEIVIIWLLQSSRYVMSEFCTHYSDPVMIYCFLIIHQRALKHSCQIDTPEPVASFNMDVIVFGAGQW